MGAMPRLRVLIPLRWSDTDAYGHINNVMFLRLLEEARSHGIRNPYLHAQVQAVPFYEKLGFSREGDEFDEAGIPHVRMSLVLE